MANSLKDTAISGKLLKAFTTVTITAMTKLDTRKHQNVVMAVYHAAEYGECSAINRLFEAFKVNDQSAFKKWIATNFNNPDDPEENWIGHTNKKDKNGKVIGFHVIKDRQDKRKGVYDFDALMALEPFYSIDVSKPKVWDLNALLEIVIKAADTVTKKSDKEGISLPAGFIEALNDAKKQAVMHHIDEAAEVVANENAPAIEQKLIANG